MSVGRLILLGLLGLVVAEAAVFLMVVWAIGPFFAVVALLGTSMLGMLVLARMGRRFASRVLDVLSRRDFDAAVPRSSAFLTTVGGLLLLLPGFITDCVGLLLLIPGVQDRLINRAPPRRRRPGGRVLDLDRNQWRDMPDRLGEDRDRLADGRDRKKRRQPRR
jgi:UPF0716 protein FxsA